MGFYEKCDSWIFKDSFVSIKPLSIHYELNAEDRLRLRQTQTKFIQQKYIQVPYQVYMSFLEIQITL